MQAYSRLLNTMVKRFELFINKDTHFMFNNTIKKIRCKYYASMYYHTKPLCT